jgi:hypothetical protein
MEIIDAFQNLLLYNSIDDARLRLNDFFRFFAGADRSLTRQEDFAEF